MFHQCIDTEREMTIHFNAYWFLTSCIQRPRVKDAVALGRPMSLPLLEHQQNFPMKWSFTVIMREKAEFPSSATNYFLYYSHIFHISYKSHCNTRHSIQIVASAVAPRFCFVLYCCSVIGIWPMFQRSEFLHWVLKQFCFEMNCKLLNLSVTAFLLVLISSSITGSFVQHACSWEESVFHLHLQIESLWFHV